MSIALYAASNRFLTTGLGRHTSHSFSFGEHYDPANLGFGPMICHNDDRLEPGSGYPDHPHADLEIVTWVLDGVLLHTDDAGHTEELRPGDVQVMSAGAGIRHSELADASSGPTRFLQAWIKPDGSGTPPRWRSEHVDPGTGLTTVVGDGGLPIGARGVGLQVARLAPGQGVHLPGAARTHAFVAAGRGLVSGLELRSGDAVRLTDQPGVRFEATEEVELLVWSFRS